MINTVLLLNIKGEILVNRIYRDDSVKNAGAAFRTQVLGAKEIRSPINVIGNQSYFHIRHGNVYLVAVTASNANAAMIFEFLWRAVEVFRSYFGTVDEESVLSNNFLIYEILDEAVDYGYPQVTSADALKMCVLEKGVRSEVPDSASFSTNSITGAVNWRREGIKYRKNEVFLDVIEKVNLLVSAKDTILRADVEGQVLMKSYLSGMPECKFGLNDKLSASAGTTPGGALAPRGGIAIDDLKFHQCVRLSSFDSDRSISFIPPDGEFTLCTYRSTENIQVPFRVTPLIKELGRTRIEAKVVVKPTFKSPQFASNVVLKIPCPANTASAAVTVTVGRAKFDSNRNAIIWKVKQWPGGQDAQLAGEIKLVASTSEAKQWSRPPIEMDFQVPQYTASGLKVRFLKVLDKTNYQTTKWVRYMTKAGSYQQRI